MKVEFTKEQIQAALNWIVECANPDWENGCVIKNPQMMQHHEFPEYLFLKYTMLKNTEASGLRRSTHYTVVDANGEKHGIKDLWDEKLVRLGIIGDLMAFRMENGKIVFE